MTDIATMLDPQHLPHGNINEELAAAARTAKAWEVATRPPAASTFQKRVDAAKQAVLKLEAELASLPATPANNDPRLVALTDMRANPPRAAHGCHCWHGKTAGYGKATAGHVAQSSG